ncbi:MAG: sulfur oxidation c-type cytochrome SoxA [Hyphomicrobiales bacterium]|nr:MAG: sulfur oxidation c-type cytochrome SoxA [Hyphomicrobiales bacterium]
MPGLPSIEGHGPITTHTKSPKGHPLDEVISGFEYRTRETQALELDDFQNPGMLAVEQGEELWSKFDGDAGKSCESCHGDASESMKGVGAAMPKWNEGAGKPVNLEMQINLCRTERMGAKPYKFNSGDQKAMVTYVRHQSRGMPVTLDLEKGEMQKWWDQGKDIYYTRYGQLELSCASCHEINYGKYIRADHLSQGQINGFPTYRLKSQGIVLTHARFKGCVRDTRAVPFKPMSDELLALEVYVAWRGTGLSVETPAVRQ